MSFMEKAANAMFKNTNMYNKTETLSQSFRNAVGANKVSTSILSLIIPFFTPVVFAIARKTSLTLFSLIVVVTQALAFILVAQIPAPYNGIFSLMAGMISMISFILWVVAIQLLFKVILPEEKQRTEQEEIDSQFKGIVYSSESNLSDLDENNKQ